MSQKGSIHTDSAEVSKDNPVIDVSKYGFILQSEKDGFYRYAANVSGEVVELKVYADSYTVKITGKRNIMVANRYKIKTQNQLDFILMNGRAGVLFLSAPCSNEAV